MTPQPESSPKRIQLRRTKGWRKPEGAIVVSRPSKWGNPWRVPSWSCGLTLVGPFGHEVSIAPGEPWQPIAARHFREDLVEDRLDFGVMDVVEELAGKDLACWCSLDRPVGWCHADVLLSIANGEAS